MKLVIAFIKDFKVDQVTTALNAIEGLTGMTLQTVEGHGRTRGKVIHDDQDPHEFVKKVRIDLFVLDHLVDEVVDVIQKNAHTGLLGDGKIYVQAVEQAVRISTNERGEQAV